MDPHAPTAPSREQEVVSPPVHIKRPIGVSVALVWAGLFAGLFPLGLALLLYFGPASNSHIMDQLQLAYVLTLSLSVIVSTLIAWRGVALACYSLVILVLIHYSLIAYNNYQLAVAGIEIRGSTVLPWARVIRSILTAAIIVAYLMLSPKARTYFRQHQQGS